MTRTRNTVLAIDNADPVWPSTRTVLHLMINCLQAAFPDAIRFVFDGLKLSPKNHRDWKTILTENKPRRIVFFVQKSPPEELLLTLNQWDPDRNTAIVFYICGSLPMWIYLWQPLENLLKGFRVAFFCSSASDTMVSRNFFRAASISVIPYPLPERTFYKRKKWKKKRSVKIIYAGRIVPQKGLHHIIVALHSFFQKQNQDWCLDIYGSSGKATVLPIASHPPDPGEYRRILQSLVRVRKIDDRVRFHGSIERTELQAIYEEADLFISLSVFHPEEFGLSPAEAIRCGCPCVISDWSGYQGLSKFAPAVFLVRPKWQNGFIGFDQKDIVNALRDWQRANLREKDRAILSRQSLRWNSETAVTRKLKSIFRSGLRPYRGISAKGIKIARMVKRKNSVFLYDFPLSIRQQRSYMEFYAPYFGHAARRK